MLQIKQNNIYLTKGDTAFLKVDLTQNGKAYQPKSGDKLTLTIKRTLAGDSVITQTVKAGESFVLTETNVDSGKYFYDVQLTTVEGYVFTVASGGFFVVAEVTV